jgi:S-DNA-T family DNA segregation ATPase FtsK/SpoIIIE
MSTMTSKRLETRNTRGQGGRSADATIPPSAAREASAVVLLCLGLLTLLSLASYHAGDISLNATGSSVVRNWIGPAGAYWADLLLQGVGISAYALGVGLLLAGGRAFAGRRILPGLREAVGTLLLVPALGALAQLMAAHIERPYPPGGVLGAVMSQLLRERFALLGAYIVASAWGLVALALTADGILLGLGLRGLGALQFLWRGAPGLWGRLAGACTGLWGRLSAAAEDEDGGAEPEAPRVRLAEPSPARARRLAKPERPAPPQQPGEEAAEVAEAPQLGKPKRLLPRRAPQPQAPETASASASASASAEAAPTPPVVQSVDGDVEAEEDDEALAARPTLAPASRAPRPKQEAEPQIVNVRPDLDPKDIERAAREQLETAGPRQFELPPASLLDYEAAVREPVDPQKLRDNALRLTKTLKDYGIDGHVREIRPGPVVTMYEYVPGPGIKLSKIAALADDLAMSMEALRVRIVAPIPGKGAVGIEIPNDTRETVYLKEIIAHDAFRKAKSRLTMALGKDIEGGAYVADLARMPHLLVAGATGAGKSVSINSMIMSVLFKATPDEVRMIMVDPKMLELSVYEGIPHLLLPVVTDPKKAALALRWAVEEMERRYELLSEVGVRSIDGYNTKVRNAGERGTQVTVPAKEPDGEPTVCQPMPYLMVIVDELADLMMVASREVEGSIMRLAQMARAAGIHLILATQRPSVDVLTGVIKANFPTRIAFQVASRHDSRTIIDANGAEHLLGRGDMLYLSPGAGGMLRVHGAYVSEEEIERAVDFVRKQGRPQYDESILAPRGDEGDGDEGVAEEMHDEMYDQAVAIVAETRQASISMIQRRLRIGYNRAARMVERMETEGIVGPADGAKPREVLVSSMAV